MWDEAGAYDRFMGRWSQAVAGALFDDAPLQPGGRILDVGCGPGTLSEVVVDRFGPALLVGVDASPAFLRLAARHVPGIRVVRADAARLPVASASFDAAVSGLVLNFVRVPSEAMAEVVRAVRSGGCVVVYVWDYDHPDFFLFRFWEALARVQGRRSADDERGRWRVCTETGLRDVARGAGLSSVDVRRVVVATRFPDADALWDGFMLGIGPSGAAARSLSPEDRDRLRSQLDEDWPRRDGGQVELTASALAVVATVT